MEGREGREEGREGGFTLAHSSGGHSLPWQEGRGSMRWSVTFHPQSGCGER